MSAMPRWCSPWRRAVPTKAASFCHVCLHPGLRRGYNWVISSAAAEGSMTDAKFEGIGFWILLMLLLMVPWILE
jgi:hypothetical protein